MSNDPFAGHLPLLRPWIDDREIAAVKEVLESGWISQGPVVERFEKAIAKLVGAPFAVATNSATSALHLAFQVTGLEPGAKVLVPAHTCMATVNGLMLAGGEPVFADIDLATYNLDPAAAESRLDGEVRAICLVHQIGLPAELDAFAALAERHRLVLVEDAATALGARYQGAYLGGHGNPTVFSFHPRKMITTGEGGMLILWDEKQYEHARRLRSGGVATSDLERHRARGVVTAVYPEPGYNYRLTDVQAAMGLAQLGKLPEMLARRRRQALVYTRALAGSGVAPPCEPAGMTHCFSSYCVRLPGATPAAVDAVLEHMAARAISCRRGIRALYREPAFVGSYRGPSLPSTETAARETLFLPIFPQMTEADQSRVLEALAEAVAICPDPLT